MSAWWLVDHFHVPPFPRSLLFHPLLEQGSMPRCIVPLHFYMKLFAPSRPQVANRWKHLGLYEPCITLLSTLMCFVSKVPQGRFLLLLWAASCTTNGQMPIFPSNIAFRWGSKRGQATVARTMTFVMYLLLLILRGGMSSLPWIVGPLQNFNRSRTLALLCQ